MIESTQNSATFSGGTAETTFPIPFPFADAAHLRVVIRHADGSADRLTIGTDYTVVMQDDGRGDIVLTREGVGAGDDLVVTRSVPLTQDTRLPEFSPVSPQAVEQALDKLTMIAQELDARLGDCIDLVVTVRDEMTAAANAPRTAFPGATGQAGPTGPNDVMVTRSVYHAAGCRHARPSGKWLHRDDVRVRYPKARPCRICHPEGEAPVVATVTAPEATTDA